jgi:2-keto-4-pentenoate hydratase/2-oxohepta-3-ene-1,7-dioic acid hydratase in catechol pathway
LIGKSLSDSNCKKPTIKESAYENKPQDKQVWLKAGDKITTVIEKLGELRFALA